jgi:hypothetical protein
MTIQPYLYNGSWVFDDTDLGLRKEPFVLGVDDMISKIVKEKNLDKNGFCLQFSAFPIPNSNLILSWLRADGGGNWYKSDYLDMEGWLCPALYKYFSEAPKNIWTIFKNKIT